MFVAVIILYLKTIEHLEGEKLRVRKAYKMRKRSTWEGASILSQATLFV